MTTLPSLVVADPAAQRNFEALGGILERPVVTALPTAGLYDGMDAYYLANSASGVCWHLKYRPDAGSAYDWLFVGGAALYANIDTQESIAPSAYGNLATAGPSIALPLAGDYEITVGAGIGGGAGASDLGFMSYDIGVTAALDIDAARGATVNSTSPVSIRRKPGLAASAAVVAKYRSTAAGASMSFRNRFLRIVPVRVG